MEDECPVCYNPWATTHIPVTNVCGHTVCRDCWDTVRNINHRCPLCRSSILNTTVNTSVPLISGCGLISTLADISPEHTSECDVCWFMVSDVDTCMVHDFDGFKRFVRGGKHPSRNAVMAAIAANCLDAVRLWASTNVVTVAMVNHAQHDEMLHCLADRCDIRECHLYELYMSGKVDLLIKLWKRGTRNDNILGLVMQQDDERTLRAIYTPGCFITQTTSNSKCFAALLDMGHAFGMQSIRTYLENDMTVYATNHFITDGTFKRTLGIDAVDLTSLASGCLHLRFFKAVVWSVKHGAELDQSKVDAAFRNPSGVSILLDGDIMPSVDSLQQMTTDTLRLVYAYQCSECDRLTSRVCKGCNYTRFCSPECEEKGTRHIPFCHSQKQKPPCRVLPEETIPEPAPVDTFLTFPVDFEPSPAWQHGLMHDDDSDY